MNMDLELFKACADSTRLRLLVLLSERELCVCELVEILDMPQGKISRHLAVLRRAGLVVDRREGTWIYYSLVPDGAGLASRIVDYLSSEGRAGVTTAADLERLRHLADCGEICARQAQSAASSTALPAAQLATP